MDATQITVGQKLRIRQWKDMQDEFGFTETGSIRTPNYSFVLGMKHLCGEDFTVASIENPYSSVLYYRSEERVEDKVLEGRGYWYIVAEMLEPVETESFGLINITPQAFFNLIK
jgi:hypothetical protein